MPCAARSRVRDVAYVLAALSSFTLAATSLAQSAPRYVPADYVQTSHDLPMRDGVTLHIEVFAPKSIVDPLPFLLQRTPYGVAGQSPRESRAALAAT